VWVAWYVDFGLQLAGDLAIADIARFFNVVKVSICPSGCQRSGGKKRMGEILLPPGNLAQF
jgi:hypothetical protein